MKQRHQAGSAATQEHVCEHGGLDPSVGLGHQVRNHGHCQTSRLTSVADSYVDEAVPETQRRRMQPDDPFLYLMDQ